MDFVTKEIEKIKNEQMTLLSITKNSIDRSLKKLGLDNVKTVIQGNYSYRTQAHVEIYIDKYVAQIFPKELTDGFESEITELKFSIGGYGLSGDRRVSSKSIKLGYSKSIIEADMDKAILSLVKQFTDYVAYTELNKMLQVVKATNTIN